MDDKVITDKQDMTHTVWSRYRNSSGTAGSFLKSSSDLDGTKKYYKLSAYDSARGIYGHECINEIIADRLLTLLQIEHVPYRLIHADVIVDDIPYDTYVCASDDFKEKGESKVSFDIFFQLNHHTGETPLEFCDRYGWRDEIDAMLLIDYLILNRDRHGANIEVLKNPQKKSFRLAPLYDHGISLLFSCDSVDAVSNFDIMEDKRIQCFVGSASAWENLKLIKNNPTKKKISDSDRDYIFYMLEDTLSDIYKDKIWKMIMRRWGVYENMQNNR